MIGWWGPTDYVKDPVSASHLAPHLLVLALSNEHLVIVALLKVHTFNGVQIVESGVHLSYHPYELICR